MGIFPIQNLNIRCASHSLAVQVYRRPESSCYRDIYIKLVLTIVTLFFHCSLLYIFNVHYFKRAVTVMKGWQSWK